MLLFQNIILLENVTPIKFLYIFLTIYVYKTFYNRHCDSFTEKNINVSQPLVTSIIVFFTIFTSLVYINRFEKKIYIYVQKCTHLNVVNDDKNERKCSYTYIYILYRSDAKK